MRHHGPARAVTSRVYPGQRGLSGQPDLESLRQAVRDVGSRSRAFTSDSGDRYEVR
jgi:hypothetical protein